MPSVAADLQDRAVAHLRAGDVDGLLEECYAPDARLESFLFSAVGRDAIADVVRLHLERTRGFGPPTVEHSVAGPDFVWFELAFDAPGGPIKTYEIKLVRDGRFYLELFGFKQGMSWQPGDFAGATRPDPAEAVRFHDTYAGYHEKGDAEGLAGLFTDDGRIVTARQQVSGGESVRGAFQAIFARESGFKVISVDNITGGPDYVWFEASATSSLGPRRLYDVMLLRDGLIALQIVGSLEGAAPDQVAAGRAARD